MFGKQKTKFNLVFARVGLRPRLCKKKKKRMSTISTKLPLLVKELFYLFFY